MPRHALEFLSQSFDQSWKDLLEETNDTVKTVKGIGVKSKINNARPEAASNLLGGSRGVI